MRESFAYIWGQYDQETVTVITVVDFVLYRFRLNYNEH